MNELIKHIQSLNEAARRKMAANPNLVIGLFTEDHYHWKSYGITTVEQFGEYLDSECKRAVDKSLFGWAKSPPHRF